MGLSEMRVAKQGLGTGVYEGHRSPGFGGVNNSALLFMYRVFGPIIHLIYLVSTHVIRLSQARRLPAMRERPLRCNSASQEERESLLLSRFRVVTWGGVRPARPGPWP